MVIANHRRKIVSTKSNNIVKTLATSCSKNFMTQVTTTVVKIKAISVPGIYSIKKNYVAIIHQYFIHIFTSKNQFSKNFLPFRICSLSGLLRLQTILKQLWQKCQKSMLSTSFCKYSLIDFKLMLSGTHSDISLCLFATEFRVKHFVLQFAHLPLFCNRQLQGISMPTFKNLLLKRRWVSHVATKAPYVTE